jgi:fucose permease
MINNIHAQEEHTQTQIRSLILLNVINVPVDTSALQGLTDLSSVQTVTIVLQVLRITSITLVHLEHIFLQEDYQMSHNAEAARKDHSARIIKLFSQKNAQLEVIVMFSEQSNQTTIILHLVSYANNACQEVNALLKAQYILRDALQALIVRMVQISVSLALKDSIAVKSIQLQFLR